MRKFHTTLVVDIDGLEPEWTMTQEMECMDDQDPRRFAQHAADSVESNTEGIEVTDIQVSETEYM